MLKGIKVQIYPTKQQEDYLNHLFGCCRYVYNKSLEYKISEYTNHKNSVNLKELGKYFTYELRAKNEWLQKQNTKILIQSVLNMLEAYKRFFVNKSGFPNFKKRNSEQSCRFTNEAISKHNLKDGKIHLIKDFRDIKFKCSNKYKEILYNNKNKIRSCTVSKNKAGKYFCSFLIDIEHEILPKVDKIIGLDVGINSFLVTSENEEINNPKFYRNNEKKISRLNKRISKKQKGSNNRRKARLKLARFHYKLNCQKRDFLHKLTTSLVKENSIICLEDLSIKEMLKNPYLAKSIQELSLFEFTRQLTYKAEWNDKLIIKVDKYFPSSQLCSNCNWRNKDLTLSDRIFKCKSCNLELNRDYNASLNIKKEALKIIGSRPPEFKPVEIETLVSSVKQESEFTVL